MKLTIFAKKRLTKEGKTFYNYLTTMIKKDGTEVRCAVKFTDDAGNPKPEMCPLNIEVDKDKCNMSTRKFTDENGDERTAFTLWVTEWTKSAEEYVDHSMDDFI